MSTKMMYVLAIAVIVSLATAVAGRAEGTNEFRTWTDSTGKFKIEAIFEKFADGKVHLKKKENGKVVTLSPAKLSKADQSYFRKLLSDQANELKAAKAKELKAAAELRATKAKAAAELRAAKAKAAAEMKAAKRSQQSSVSPEKSEVQKTAAAAMSWEGTWNNRKYGTKGPLRCTVKVKDANTWEAKFVGTGLGKPFTYQAIIKKTKRGERMLLQGTSTISGDQYRWTGQVEGDKLSGKYRSGSGNNGEFHLKESRKKNVTKR